MLALPTDSRIPATLAVRDAREDEQQPWQEPYVSRFVTLSDDRDRVAWFHFCTGHHVEFLYWEATLLACERLISAAENGDKVAATQWLARAAKLIRGSGAMLHYCAAFDPARYDPCLRPQAASRATAIRPQQHRCLAGNYCAAAPGLREPSSAPA